MQHEDLEEFISLSITDEKNINVDVNGDGDIDGDEYWEKKLPVDYERYTNISDKPLNYTTKKELYLCLCEGFLGYESQMVILFFIFFNRKVIEIHVLYLIDFMTNEHLNLSLMKYVLVV